MISNIEIIKKWIGGFIISYNLCPFASPSFTKDRIRYVDYIFDDTALLLEKVITEVEYLDSISETLVSNTIIILSNFKTSFLDFYDIFLIAEELVEQSPFNEFAQLVSFHPQYQFADTEIESARNYTNRSPIPLIQILRKSEVKSAIDNYKNAHEIPIENEIKLSNMSQEELNKFIPEK
jgi:hypothetical protein